jgi:hypothetical protein
MLLDSDKKTHQASSNRLMPSLRKAILQSEKLLFPSSLETFNARVEVLILSAQSDNASSRDNGVLESSALDLHFEAGRVAGVVEVEHSEAAVGSEDTGELAHHRGSGADVAEAVADGGAVKGVGREAEVGGVLAQERDVRGAGASGREQLLRDVNPCD